MEIEEQYPSEEEVHRENLKNSLESYVAPSLANPKGSFEVLSVGCGMGYDAGAVLDAFPDASYRGIDIDKQDIEFAQQINAALGDKVAFEVQDARDISSFGDKELELIILKHLPIMGTALTSDLNPRDAKLIFQNAITKLKEGGVVFATMDNNDAKTYRDYIEEFEDLKILVDRSNEFSTPGTTFPDSYVIVAQKQPKDTVPKN